MKQRTIGFAISAGIASALVFVTLAQESPSRPAVPRGLRIVQGAQPSASATVVVATAANPTEPRLVSSPNRAHERLGPVAKATDVIGKEVMFPTGEKLGKIDELAVDLESARIVLVILSSNGVPSMGEATVAIPPQAFKSAPSKTAFQLDVDKEKFKSAPVFEMTKWEEYWEPNRVVEVYRRYGHEPYLSSTSTESIKHVTKATRFIGSPIRNHENEKVGSVDNLTIDLGAGRVMLVILSSGSFLGLGDELSAVPPGAFRYDPAQGSFVLKVSKAELESAPRFKKTQWLELSDPEYVGSVYRAYRMEPYFRARPGSKAGASAQDGLTPLDQGTGEADVATTRRIRQEIVARDGLSLHARNVKVITLNGRVTLRGFVQSEEEKRIVGEIARQTAGGERVDNQLEVKRDVP